MILRKYNKLNITFCGMMGAGKSIIGKRFAKLIDFNFIDTDALIEQKTGKSIDQIFTDFGENYFRELEESIISNILYKKNYIFSLGGGSITNKKLRNIIKKNSFNIYLEVEVDILSKRLANSKNRPLINEKNIVEKLVKLKNKREKFYKEADLIIKNDKTTSNAIKELINYFKIYD